MVSIFADTIIQDTITISLSDGVSFGDADNPNILGSATATVNEFLYVDTFRVNLTGGDIDLDNTSGFDRDAKILFDIDFLYGAIPFNSLGTFFVLDELVPENQKETVSFDFTDSSLTDFYIDSSLNVNYEIKFDENGGLLVDGNQTVDFDLEIIAIGRGL